MVDVSKLSYAELQELEKAAKAAQKAKQKEALQDAYRQFQEIAKAAGVSVEEIVKAGKAVKNKRPAKYKNPADASQTWSGQGRKPAWLEAELKKGKKLEDFLIK